MLGNPSFQQNDDRAVLVLRQDIHSFCPRRYVEGLMMSCRLARPKSGLIERQLLGDFGVATDGGIWVAAGDQSPVTGRLLDLRYPRAYGVEARIMMAIA